MTKSNYTFSLKRIELADKSMYWERMKQESPFQFGLQIQLSHVPKENESHLLASVQIVQESENEVTNELASIRINFVFNIPYLHEYRKEHESQAIHLPDDFMLLLNTVVIGTLRGVMFSEFRGTFLHDAILPVIDPSQMTTINHSSS